jgi:hypothetical protein
LIFVYLFAAFIICAKALKIPIHEDPYFALESVNCYELGL